ncbi:MAG TPA: polysaccharide deacetylase family protein [Rariglobus sp.]|nr:polysaccharide deacetylase family protein [Rariglobus sp.]
MAIFGSAAFPFSSTGKAQPSEPDAALAPLSQKLPDGHTVKIVKCYPDGLMRAYCVSFDDGTLGSDWPVLDALRSRHIPATFFINSLHPQSKDAVAFPQRYAGFEVASHGAHHKGLGSISLPEARQEISEDQRILGEKFKCQIDGFAYPYGDVPKTPEARLQLDKLLTELGIIYARGTRTTNAYRPPVDFLRWDTDCGFLTGPEKLLAQPADDSVRVMMSFAHSIDFARGSMPFEKWEHQLDQLAADKTIWKVTMHDFARYVTALRALTVTSDGLKNDSEIAVWVRVNTKVFSIPAKTTLAWSKIQ